MPSLAPPGQEAMTEKYSALIACCWVVLDWHQRLWICFHLSWVFFLSSYFWTLQAFSLLHWKVLFSFWKTAREPTHFTSDDQQNKGWVSLTQYLMFALYVRQWCAVTFTVKPAESMTPNPRPVFSVLRVSSQHLSALCLYLSALPDSRSVRIHFYTMSSSGRFATMECYYSIVTILYKVKVFTQVEVSILQVPVSTVWLLLDSCQWCIHM